MLVTPVAGELIEVYTKVGLAASVDTPKQKVPSGASSLAIFVDNGDDSATTVDIDVEWSPDGDNWFDAATTDEFAQLTADEKIVKVFTVKGAWFRCEITIGGTADTDITIRALGIAGT